MTEQIRKIQLKKERKGKKKGRGPDLRGALKEKDVGE